MISVLLNDSRKAQKKIEESLHDLRKLKDEHEVQIESLDKDRNNLEVQIEGMRGKLKEEKPCSVYVSMSNNAITETNESIRNNKIEFISYRKCFYL